MEPITPTPPVDPSQPEVVPEKLELKKWMIELLEEELKLDEDDKKEIRDKIVDIINKAVDIPIIGEKLEEKLFSFAVKMVERVGLHYGKKLIDLIF